MMTVMVTKMTKEFKSLHASSISPSPYKRTGGRIPTKEQLTKLIKNYKMQKKKFAKPFEQNQLC